MTTTGYEVRLYHGSQELGRAYEDPAGDWFWRTAVTVAGGSVAIGPFVTIQAAVSDLISYFTTRTP